MSATVIQSRPIKLAKPERCPGCYSLHLYCDHGNPEHGYGAFPVEIDGWDTPAEARRCARSRGWKLHKDGTATCPICVRALRSPSPA